MAFSVSPTSGSAPYVLEADFENRLGFDTGTYGLFVYATTTAGSCPPLVTTGTNIDAAATALLDVGSYSTTTTVPAGSCRTFSLVIKNLATSDVVGSSIVSVSNL